MTPDPRIRIRQANIGDVPAIVDFRARMFREMGWIDERRLAQVDPLARQYLLEEFASGGCSGFMAEELPQESETVEVDQRAKPVGSVVLVWQRVPPGVRNLKGLQAYALGMYVVPELRRRGIARALMTKLIDCATQAGAPVITLHASDEGRPLYEQLGFRPTHEMRYFTDHAQPAAWAPIDDAD